MEIDDKVNLFLKLQAYEDLMFAAEEEINRLQKQVDGRLREYRELKRKIKDIKEKLMK